MENYYNFKKVRNQIRKLDTLSLVHIASSKLRFIESTHVNNWHVFLPWYLLLLIKLSFEYGGENFPLRQADEIKLIKLINLLHEFEENAHVSSLEGENEFGVTRFLRRISFQQFWLQVSLNNWTILRQREIFCKLDENDEIRAHIEKNLNGLPIHTFLELSFIVWAWLSLSPNNRIFDPEKLFSDMIYSKQEILSFCSSLSLDHSGIKKYLSERKQKIDNEFFQLLEVTPFTKYPFLMIENEYLVYSKKVFAETISNCFYDKVKSEGGNDLTQKFGFLFERYIDKCISTINYNSYTERDLRKEFPNKKVTDFLIPFEDMSLMIEAKAVEMRPIVKVNPEEEVLQKELKDSIIKGVVQGFTLANSLLLHQDNLILSSRKKFFLMIVTYKDLYLGAGDDMWNEFLRNSVEPILLKNNLNKKILPPENIIILSIDEFDVFISIIYENKHTAGEILDKMILDNQNPQTKKWTFKQHLDKYIANNLTHPILDEEHNKFLIELSQKAKEKIQIKNSI